MTVDLSLHDGYAGWPFDEFDFIAILGIDEDEATAGGGLSRAIGDLHALHIQWHGEIVRVYSGASRDG